MTQSETDDPSRIEINPEIMLGKPVVRGTRIPIYLIVDWVESGHTPEEIVEGYPGLSVEDVAAAVTYTQAQRKQTEVHVLP